MHRPEVGKPFSFSLIPVRYGKSRPVARIGPAARTERSASRIAASKEGVPAMFGGVVSFDLINAFAAN